MKEWGQQADGLWASPRGEWDSQGQALWTLIHHYELTGDVEWLRSNYESIRRGAQWIKDATAQTKQRDVHGRRPITWGLLPKGVSEDTGSSAWTYIYEHDFWVVFGLREAIKAAEVLGHQDDVRWMRELDKEFSADLLAFRKTRLRNRWAAANLSQAIRSIRNWILTATSPLSIPASFSIRMTR